MKILILGGTGMLGHVLFRALSARTGLSVHATVRSADGLDGRFPADLKSRIVSGVDAEDFEGIRRVIGSLNPAVVINCIGLIKQLPAANEPLPAITINAQLPHRIAAACRDVKARMIHVSTDCVFDGKKGGYTEKDHTNAADLYGRTKMLGEVEYPHCVTLRSSIIGHELKTRLGLVEWFLSQDGSARGFTKAIYSGFPTIEMARVVSDFVLPNLGLHGIYNVSSEPISKYDLLQLVAKRYGKRIRIDPFDGFESDRSLNSAVFRAATGYVPPSWEKLVEDMHADYLSHIEGYHAVA